MEIQYKEYMVRSLRELDIPEISVIVSKMSGYNDAGYEIRSTSPEYYSWMYFKNPTGKAISYVATYKDKVVSCFSIAPKTFFIAGREVVVGKTMDMYTLIEHQGKGLISQLYRNCLKGAAEAGIEAIYVTPSIESYPIFVKRYGYEEYFRNYQRVGILSYAKLIGMLSGYKWLGNAFKLIDLLPGRAGPYNNKPSNYDFQKKIDLGPEIEQFWNGLEKNEVSLKKDRSYLTWRYLNNPDKYDIIYTYKNNTLMGILILKITLRRNILFGEIVDVICSFNDIDCFKAMLKFACDKFRNDGCALVQTWVTAGNWVEKCYLDARLGFKRKDIPILINQEFRKHFKEAWDVMQGDGNDL